MKKIIFFGLLVYFTSISFSQNFIFEGKDNQYYSSTNDAKIVFLEDKIKFIKNDNEYIIDFLNSNSRSFNERNSIIVNYYNDNKKIENVKVFTKLNYGDIEISISDKIILKNIDKEEVLINKKHLSKLNKTFLGDNEIFEISNLELDYKIEFSSIIGGAGSDLSGSSAKDEQGNVYFSGFTSSNLGSWLIDSYDATLNGNLDYFVIKMDKDNQVIWGTYIGSPSLDGSCYMDVKDGMIWVGGETHGDGFPTFEKSVQKTHKGDGDFSIFRLNYDGKLEFATYNGGNAYDTVLDVKIDEFGNAWVTGRTGSNTGMYVTQNAVNKTSNGFYDAFIMCFNKDNDCIYSSYYGGSGSDLSESMCITNKYIIFGGYSSSNDLPMLLNNNTSNNFIMAIDKKTYEVAWSYKYNADGYTNVQNLQPFDNQSFIVSGYTDYKHISKGNVFQSENNGGLDMFISKFKEDGELIKTTYLGGKGDEGRRTTDFQGGGIYLDDKFNIYVSGYTNSNDFPITDNAFQKSKNSNNDAFITVFDSELENILYSTYLGGSSNETGRDVLWSNNKLYINGWTQSSDFPLTNNAFQTHAEGNYTAFLTILSFQAKDPDPDPTPYSIYCDNSLNNYPNFSELRRIDLIGDVFKIDSTLILTNNLENQTGGVWSDIPYDVRGGFTSEFVFQISDGDDFGYSDSFNPGADGIAFVLQADNKGVLGNYAGGIGYEGLANAFAIEIDLYWNDQPEYNDPNGNHLAIFSSKEEISADHHSNDLLFQFDGLEPIEIDNTKYKMLVEYDADNLMLDVYLSKFNEEYKLVANIPGFDINSHLNLISNRGAFIGLTSSTGNSVQIHKLNSWYFCTGGEVPLPESIGEILSFPNPAVDYLNIKSDEIYEEVSITDIMGTKYSFDPNSTKIDISKFNTGIYILELKVGGKIKVQKFIKE